MKMTLKQLAHEFFLGIREAMVCPDVSVSEYEGVIAYKIEQYFSQRMESEIDILTIEVARLKRGDFTPEEFQNLCHNLHERPVCTREEFSQGCLQFQEKLFGKEPPCLTEIFFVAMCRGDGTLPKPEKAWRGKFFFDLQEAKTSKFLWSGERFEGLGVFRCAMEVVEEVKE